MDRRRPRGCCGDAPLADLDLAAGARLYAEHSAACHGADLEGQPDWQTPGPDGVLPAPPHDATGHTWHHSDDVLFDYTRPGGAGFAASRDFRISSGMPAFGDTLTDRQIWEVLGYIKSTWPERERAAQAASTRVAN